MCMHKNMDYHQIFSCDEWEKRVLQQSFKVLSKEVWHKDMFKR